MEDTDLLKMVGVSTSGVAIAILIYRILVMIRGKKIVSSCCGKRLEVGIDVQSMTPVPKETENPIRVVVPTSSSSH